MRGYLVAAALSCLAAAASASAAAYDSFAAGLSDMSRGDADAAIDDFGAAIAAGDLAPALLPTAYHDRAKALRIKGRCADALADLDAAHKLKPDDKDVLWDHARAAKCVGRLDLALADDTGLIALNSYNGFSARGYTRWALGDFSGAADDFASDFKRYPENIYSILWYELSRARAGGLDLSAVARDAPSPDTGKWPDAVFALYAGKIKPEDIAAAAARGDASAFAARNCEADFYLGEWWLMHGDAASARPLLQRAFDTCPHNYVEYENARVELDRMK